MNAKRIEHWIPCPLCTSRTDIKVYEDTVMIKFPLYCPKCKKETRITVVQLRMGICEDE